MKLTDLVGRLAPKYPGLMTRTSPMNDSFGLYVPSHFSVKVSRLELEDMSDDALVEAINDRIQEAVGSADA